MYSKEQNEELKINFESIEKKYSDLIFRMQDYVPSMKNQTAQEFCTYGVCRRLRTLKIAITNIFQLYPLENEVPLSLEQLANIEINIHASIFNTIGICDCLALMIAHENGLIEGTDSLHRNDITLFSKKFLNKIDSEDFKKTISKTKEWHNNYIKVFRDNYAHRIPPYIPPAILSDDEKNEYIQITKEIDKVAYKNFDRFMELQSKRDKIGKCLPVLFVEESPMINFHAQLVVDFLTIENLLNGYLETLNK